MAILKCVCTGTSDRQRRCHFVCVQGHETGEDVQVSLCVYRGIRLRQPCRFESVQGHQAGENDHVSLCVYRGILG